jgi:hypothetical protein
MSRFDQLDEQAQQEWQARVAQKRLALSASVEETLQDSSLAIEEEFEEEEEEEQMTSSAKDTHNTTLIPPRLSLQSKQLPLMHAQSTSRSTKLPSTPTTDEDHEPISVDNIHTLARLTRQLAVVDGTISAASIPYDAQSMPKIESVSSAQPITHTAQLPVTPRSQAVSAFPVIPPSRPPELPPMTPDTQHSLKRTTKVRLQVVPKPDLVERTVEGASSLYDTPTNPSLPAIKPVEKDTETMEQVSLVGSGAFESGQSEVAVANTSITSASVVVVVLIGDPGPVVAQYISLQPGIGFTVHLSAPTKNVTPFNYKIL